MNSNDGYNNNFKKSDNIETSNCFQPLSSRLGKYTSSLDVFALDAPIIREESYVYLSVLDAYHRLEDVAHL